MGLKEIEGLAQRAAGGEWYAEEGTTSMQLNTKGEDGDDEPCWLADFGLAPGQYEAAQLTAAMHNALPALLDVAKSVTRVRDRRDGEMVELDVEAIRHFADNCGGGFWRQWALGIADALARLEGSGGTT